MYERVVIFQLRHYSPWENRIDAYTVDFAPKWVLYIYV